MFRLVTTGLSEEGIALHPRELDDLGCLPGSEMAGALVRGHLDKGINWGTDSDSLYTQGPHLVLSPVPFHQWCSAFGVEMILPLHAPSIGRSRPKPGDRFDPVVGAIHALAACGVNIIQNNTIQVGNNMMRMDAICTLPNLDQQVRTITTGLQESLSNKRALIASSTASPKQRADAVREMDVERENALRAIGALVLPALADLESRLLLLGCLRDQFHATSTLPGDRRKGQHVVPEGKDVLAQIFADETPEDPQYGFVRLEQSAHPLATQSFVSRKALENGCHPYFLTEEELLEGASQQKPHKFYDDLARRLTPAPATRRASPHPNLQLSASHPLVRQVAESLRLKDKTPAERLRLRRLRSFYRRQALWPVALRALPTLAHAAIWVEGESMNFVYKDRYLQLTAEQRDAYATTGVTLGRRVQQEAIEMARDSARLRPADPSEPPTPPNPEFALHDSCQAHFDIDNRLIRLRFTRRSVDRAIMVRVRLSYSVKTSKAADALKPEVSGLLANVLTIFEDNLLRCESVQHLRTGTIEEGEAGSGGPRGSISLLLRWLGESLPGETSTGSAAAEHACKAVKERFAELTRKLRDTQPNNAITLSLVESIVSPRMIGWRPTSR